ncbi:MAG: helix-turn-helix domain-containing protein [Anaerorhabdus sp.]
MKKHREHQGITQESLAERLDISVRYLMFIENENKYPSFKLLFKIINDYPLILMNYSILTKRFQIQN